MPKRENPQTKWLIKAMEMSMAKGKGLWAHSLLDLLEGLTVLQAAWKPPQKGAHSIWEIVQHNTYWKDYLLQRLQGQTAPASDEESWTVLERGEDAWVRAVLRLKRSHSALLKHLRTETIDFSKPVRGTKSKVGDMLFGVLAHDCYHTGQIVALRQMQGLEL